MSTPRLLIIGTITCAFFAILWGTLLASCTWQKQVLAGYKSITAVRMAGDKTDKTLAEICKAKRLDCIEKHQPDTVKLRACMDDCNDALNRWVNYAKPSINSALELAYAGILTAHKAKQGVEWTKLIKPSACGLLRVLKLWRHLMPEKFDAIITPIVALEGLVCQ